VVCEARAYVGDASDLARVVGVAEAVVVEARDAKRNSSKDGEPDAES
jgi:hypothetical protein